MSTITQSYIGKGSVYLARANAGLIKIGQTSKVDFSVDEEKKELADNENPGGGVADSVSRIKSVKIGLTVHRLSPENLGIALRGSTATQSAGAVADEEHLSVRPGGLVPFVKTPDPAVAIVVKNDAGTVTYTEGVDYLITRAGIVVTDGGGIAEGSNISVSYTALKTMSVEALTATGQEMRFFFDGINEANGLPMQVEAFRIKPGVAKGWSLIGDDFAGLEIEADVLKDEARTGSGLSQYFRAQMAVPA